MNSQESTNQIEKASPQGVTNGLEPMLDVNLQPEGSRLGNWLNRNRLRLSVGALAVSTAATLALNPLESTVNDVAESAPWVAAGLVGSEALWVGGAAMMLAAGGKKVGNLLKVHSRMEEISQNATETKLFKAGLAVNTVGAVATAGVVAAGVVGSLPAEAWPGGLGLVAADLTMTVAVRKAVYGSIASSPEKDKIKAEKTDQKEKLTDRPTVRQANLADIDQLAELDLLRFRKAYGNDIPSKREVVDMFTKRLQNSPEWMFVAEIDGQIEGFVSAFRTNSPIENFVSWEESTAEGTLDGKVDPKGKYVYIVNMTANPKATETGAEDMLIANLFANGIAEGVEYGYFVSRMPLFKRWLQIKGKKGEVPEYPSKEQLDGLAAEYVSLKRETKDGEARFDYELRMYEESGFSLERVVPNGFSDEASLNYGVVCKADVPPHNRLLKSIKPVRSLLSKSLRLVAKNPKLLKKVL